MKLTSVELHPANSDNVAVFSFRDRLNANPYLVKAITGIDADEIAPGGHILEKRDIVIRTVLNPSFADNVSFSQLRDDIYRLIASSRTGSLTVEFKNGATVVATISGSVTKVEATHFERQPEVQITINCPYSMFRAPTATEVDISEMTPALMVVDNSISTAPHGFFFDVTTAGARASIILTDPNDSSWDFEVQPWGGFLAGDRLLVSSEHGNKYVRLERASIVYEQADRVVSGSIWPTLFPGENSFAFASPVGLTLNGISYRPTYWGV